MVTTANSWVKFFKDAGVPSAASATYAHIFHENRMELDMLTDLNKEYLREMGITPMGDIISILRHAKKVYEQNTRDRILSNEKQAITTASVSPLVASKVTKINLLDDDEKMEVSVAPSKPPRRVLPEHERRYKVALPPGSHILAKQATVYSDKVEKKPAGIFDRLEQSKPDATRKIQRIKVTTANKSTASSSIFARLGGKDEDDEMEEDNPAFAGMIKIGTKKLMGIKKPIKTQHKIMLVKKIPAKAAATMVADEYLAREKSVKFSTTDEILEIESRKQALASRNKRININEVANVKARLGMNRIPIQLSSQQTAALLQRTKKVIKLKQPVKRANGQILNVSHLKSDEAVKPVKSRLLMKRGLGDGGTVKKIAERFGRVSLKSRLGKTKAKDSSSVFDRLGFNKK